MRCMSKEEGKLAPAEISITLITELREHGSGLEEELIVVNLVAHREQVVPVVLAEHTLQELNICLIQISLGDIVTLISGSGLKSL